MPALPSCFREAAQKQPEKAPSLPKLVTTNPSAWSRTFKITNLKKTDKVIKVVSKDEKIVEAGWYNDEKVLILSTLNCAKTGETDVIVKVKRNKKTYSLKVHVNSKAWKTPFKKLKVGTKDLTNRATWTVCKPSEEILFRKTGVPLESRLETGGSAGCRTMLQET